jgi:protein ImuB
VLDSLRRLQANPASAADPVAERRATAVVDLEGGGKVICDCDAEASAAGITRGMALNSALALLPSMQVLAREVAREHALLEAVAACALDFTPRVSLEPPDGVLLEVRGSLRLFGGARRLLEQLRRRLQALGLEPRLALTPTSLASLWFARSGEEVVLRRRDELVGRLAALPLTCTRWPAMSLQSLGTMGVRNIGDCLRLPRDGFARRFLPETLRSLDRATGRAADPRRAFIRRERFRSRRDLEPEIGEASRLCQAAGPLLEELEEFLRLRGQGVEALELRLLHRDSPATRVRLRFAGPVVQAARIAELLRERFGSLELPAPVRALRLRSGPLVEAPGQSADLFALERRSVRSSQFIERLRARLGDDSVQGIRLVHEHRPEFASEDGEIGNRLLFRETAARALCRPLWLLAEPRLLAGRDRPRYEGPLEIEEGPERIESGWWDGRDVMRDYYVARTATGMQLWIFRERRAEGCWFLHGVFG